MVVGFLGKGGVGKSTFTQTYVTFLANAKNTVLAIDADHNMDTVFNLGVEELPFYLGSSLIDIKKSMGLGPDQDYRLVFERRSEPVFSLDPADGFTEKYSIELKPGLRLMAAGPQTDDVLFDLSCSHVLFTALKIYLPLLDLKANQYVVVDEKAGADGVTTGIVSGFDCAVVVSDSSPHAMKTAKQIVGLLEHFNTPSLLVANKISSDDEIKLIEETVGKHVVCSLPFRKDIDGSDAMKTLNEAISRLPQNDSRLERTVKKFQRNKHYQHA